MAHTPEHVKRFVCVDCHLVYAGTPIRTTDTGHTFEPPTVCAVCGETEFVSEADWIHHHE
jgi:hypothetical protein